MCFIKEKLENPSLNPRSHRTSNIAYTLVVHSAINWVKSEGLKNYRQQIRKKRKKYSMMLCIPMYIITTLS